MYFGTALLVLAVVVAGLVWTGRLKPCCRASDRVRAAAPGEDLSARERGSSCC